MTKIRKPKVLGKFQPKLAAPLDTLAHMSPNLSDEVKTYHKRQLAKNITLSQVFKLIDLESPLRDAYWDTYHCNRILVQEGHKIRASYCNQRWCTVCGRVRMAKMINGYSVPINKLKDLQFVTLTAPNVTGENLSAEINRFFSVWRKIYKYLKKYTNFEIVGIRKLECTYNTDTGCFNPHYHFMINGKEVAQEILKQWMKHNPKASKRGQEIQQAYGNSMLELFKYTVKGIHKGKFQASAVDIIYQSMRNRKTVFPIGIKKYIEENIDGIKSENFTFKGFRDDIWIWNKDAKDWVSEDGELLTGVIIKGEIEDWVNDLIEPKREPQKSKWTKDIGKD